MRQNRHNLLAFPKFKQEGVYFESEGKALLELFCH